MITEFPIFSKITFEEKRLIDEFNSQFPPYADWAFGTLMTWWDAFDDLEVSRLKSNLVIKSSYLSLGEKSSFVLLGSDDIDEAIETLFSYQKNVGLDQELYSLPQYTIDAINSPSDYIIVDDPNAAEYILSTEMHAKLDDPSMSRIKKKIKQFRHATEEHTVELAHVTLDNFPAKMRLINSLHTWHDIYKNDSERLEGAVIDRSLLIAEHIGLECLGLFIDKKLQSFALYKRLSPDSINVNHIKTSYNYPSIFSYTTHLLATYAYDHGISYMNFEQDLGIEGLRTHKTRLRPVEKFHKYNVYPKY